MTKDIYPAICVAAVGRYGGVVRDIHKGAIAYCEHVHKKRSTAQRCAENLMADLLEEEKQNNMTNTVYAGESAYSMEATE